MTRTMSFGYHGDGGLGDRLLGAVLRGEKTATSSLAVEYLSGDPLPRVGERRALVDHGGRRHGTVETTRVRIIPLGGGVAGGRLGPELLGHPGVSEPPTSDAT